MIVLKWPSLFYSISSSFLSFHLLCVQDGKSISKLRDILQGKIKRNPESGRKPMLGEMFAPLGYLDIFMGKANEHSFCFMMVKSLHLQKQQYRLT